MRISEFRFARTGPEADVQNAVLLNLNRLFPTETFFSWTAVSLPIGAGLPDIVLVRCYPAVVRLEYSQPRDAEILALLRSSSLSAVEISQRLRRSTKEVEADVDELRHRSILAVEGDRISLVQDYRDVLREVITIEAKVSNWQKAVAQAARNTIFSNYSYVAMPEIVSRRVRQHQEFQLQGVGIVAINAQGEAWVTKRPRRHRPKVWAYYYQLAILAANHFSGAYDAVSSTYR